MKFLDMGLGKKETMRGKSAASKVSALTCGWLNVYV